MTVSFVEFDKVSGEIYRSGSCGESDLEQQKGVAKAGSDVMQVESIIDDSLFYISGGTVCSRPGSPVSVNALRVPVGVDVIFEGVPIDATVRHPDGLWVSDSEALHWASSEPGVFFIEIEKFPHRNARFEIEVVGEDPA